MSKVKRKSVIHDDDEEVAAPPPASPSKTLTPSKTNGAPATTAPAEHASITKQHAGNEHSANNNNNNSKKKEDLSASNEKNNKKKEDLSASNEKNSKKKEDSSTSSEKNSKKKEDSAASNDKNSKKKEDSSTSGEKSKEEPPAKKKEISLAKKKKETVDVKHDKKEVEKKTDEHNGDDTKEKEKVSDKSGKDKEKEKAISLKRAATNEDELPLSALLERERNKKSEEPNNKSKATLKREPTNEDELPLSALLERERNKDGVSSPKAVAKVVPKIPPAKKRKVEESESESESESSEESSEDDFVQKKKKTPLKKAAAKPSPKQSTPKTTPKKSTPQKKKPVKKDSDDSSSEDDRDEDNISLADLLKKSVKEEKSTPKKTTTKAKSPAKSTPKSTPKGKRKLKEEPSPKSTKKGKKEEEGGDQFKWWEEKEKLPEGQKWRTLEHNGVIFPPAYQSHGVRMLYDGKPVDLTPAQEEVATFYAQQLKSPHVQKAQFNKNFFAEFRKVLGTKHTIKEFSKCDFSPIHEYLMQQKEERKAWTKEQKQADKEEKAKLQEKFGWAMVDGHKQKIGNFRVEPPGLFLGRGDHPKTGFIKKRIMPEDVTINIGKHAKAPVCPIQGHQWKAVVHDNTVTWLAFWKENINDQFKYVWLSASSHIKGQSDFKKFEVARKLGQRIDHIRKICQKELKSKDTFTQQRATALWLIDKLALRVGNEKGSDEADTVGCCSLRVEHLKLEKPQTVHFDFLGKDSMRYQKTVDVEPQVFANLLKFTQGKSQKDDLFDKLTTTALNNHLKQQMEKLTAKVFRTYNASFTLQQLLSQTPDNLGTLEEKVLYYNRCNREVAILCNHQRSLPKTFSEQMEKLDEKIAQKEEFKKELEAHLKSLKSGKAPKKAKKDDDEEKKPLPDDPEKIKNKIKKTNEDIKKLQIKKTEKEDLKTVALGTSKINYLDPRITAAWCTKWEVPISRIFSKTLREKFPWALDVKKNWSFNDPPESNIVDQEDEDEDDE